MSQESFASAMDVMGFTDFMSEKQQKLIELVMDGHDVIGILPTGGGKSASYILPTIANRWCTLVISPLKALMEDQVQKLRERGLTAFAIHSGISAEEKLEAVLTLRSARQGARFVYAAPEMVLSAGFQRHFGTLPVDLLAIDEAHCVSTWGDSFRPNYLRLPEVARLYGNPQTLAISATIDKKMEADIRRRIRFSKDLRIVRERPYRENLTIRVEKPGNTMKKVEDRNRLARQRLMQLLDGSGPAIVYCWSRAGAGTLYQRVAPECRRRGYTPILYHAMVGEEDKERALRNFLNKKTPLVIATTAFGMGIDRPDIRSIIHFDPPNTLVDFAQQIGRAGRDGLPATCVTFHHSARLKCFESFREISVPTSAFVESVYAKLVRRWKKYPPKERSTFNVAGFFANQVRAAQSKEDEFNNLELYLQRLAASQSILQRIGAIHDGENGVELRPLKPGTKRFERLLEETEMTTRKLQRESERLTRFFEAESPDQTLLWEIIGS